MMRRIRYATELRRFTRNPLTIAALVVVASIPLLYGALYLWAFWNPTAHLERLPVALVVQDSGATAADGTRVEAGATVADELTRKKTLAWHRTNPAEAMTGLGDGDYLAVLTIPENFSAAVVSAGTDHPERAPLQVRYNDANGYTARTVVSSVMREVRVAVSSSLGEQLVDKLLIGFTEIHQNLAKAADGGRQVNDGAASARDGSARLADGAGELAAGASRLDDGAASAAAGSATLADGAASLAAGAHSAADGATALSGGLSTLRTSSSSLPGSTRTLATGAQQVADGNRQLATTVARVADRVDAADERLGRTATDLQTSRQQTLDALTAYVDAHPEDAATADLLARLRQSDLDTALGDLRSQAAQLRTATDQARTDTARLATGAQQVADGNAALATAAPQLTSGISSAADGAGRLVTGTQSLASGADRLASGSAELHTGLVTLADGAAGLDRGAGTLATGANDLHSGLVQLVDGTTQLSQGLQDGQAKVPTYDEQQRDATSSVLADPVSLDTRFSHEAEGNGEGFAPYFVGLSLYVGAMVLWMVLRPVAPRLLATGASVLRVTLYGLRPAAAMGAVQVALLAAALVAGLGLNTDHLAATIGFMLLTSLAFIALQQAIGIAFGPPGRVLVLVLMMLQLTSAGGTYPPQLTPTFFQRLHELLPMSQVVNGLREAITGELDARFWAAVLYLVGLTLASVALAYVASARSRVLSVTKLHPAMSL